MSTTWNPSDKGSGITLSGGDLTVSAASTSVDGVRATASKASGKWYFEFTMPTVTSPSSNMSIGLANGSWANTSDRLGTSANSVMYRSADGQSLFNGSGGTYGAWSNGDVIGVAFEPGVSVDFYKNNTLIASYSSPNVPSGALYPAAGGQGAGTAEAGTVRFALGEFTYSPPTGFSAFDVTDFSITGSGGVSVGGEAATLGNAITMNGGVSVGGAATIEARGALLVTTEGGTLVGGSASIEFTTASTITVTPTGGAVLGGAATVMEVIPHIPSGGAVCGGAAVILEAIPFIPSGGAVAGGAASHVAKFRPTVSGGGVLAGEAPAAFVSIPVPSGGAVLAGEATVTERSAWHMPTGGVVLAGSALAYLAPADYPGTTANPYSRLFPGWALNLESGAPSRYARLPANSICHFNGVDYCANAGGVYSIDSDDDDGQAIRAGLQLAQSDYGAAENKRVPTAYVAARADGQLRLSVSANSGAAGYYLLTPDPDKMSAVRVPLGRGLEGRYWTWRLDNVDGCDFEVESLVFTPSVLQRKGR